MSELLIDTLKRNFLQKALDLKMQMDMDTVAGAEVVPISDTTPSMVTSMDTSMDTADYSVYIEGAETHSQPSLKTESFTQSSTQ